MKRGDCTPEQRAVCPLAQCFRDVHHRYWPKRWYSSGVAREFRELDGNKEVMCRNEHNELHATTPPPGRPNIEEMRLAIAQAAMDGAA